MDVTGDFVARRDSGEADDADGEIGDVDTRRGSEGRAETETRGVAVGAGEIGAEAEAEAEAERAVERAGAEVLD